MSRLERKDVGDDAILLFPMARCGNVLIFHDTTEGMFLLTPLAHARPASSSALAALAHCVSRHLRDGRGRGA